MGLTERREIWMNKVVYVLLGLSLAANGYFLVNSNLQKEKVIVKEVSTRKSEVKAQVEDKTDKQVTPRESEGQDKEQLYLDKIAELENEITLLKQQQDEFTSKPTGAFTFKTSEALDKELVEKLNLDLNKPMEDFENELVDPAWAFKHQDAIYEVFTNSGITSQINLKDVTCKTSVCKISMETFDSKQSSKIMAMMDASEILNGSDLLKDFGNRSNIESGTNNLFMYLYVEDEGEEE